MICKCGHAYEDHSFLNIYGFKDQCRACDGDSYIWLHNFKADNLKFLEKKYEESIK